MLRRVFDGISSDFPCASRGRESIWLRTASMAIDAFAMKPDISLMSDNRATNRVMCNLSSTRNGSGLTERAVIQNTASAKPICTSCSLMGKRYDCKQVALVYPETERFREILRYKFDEELSLSCFPFDVTDPKCSVKKILNHLQDEPMKVIQ